MSHYLVSDEAMGSLWSGLERDFEELAVASGVGEALTEVLRLHFYHIICGFPHSAISSVVASTPGAPDTLRITVSDNLHGHLTATAQDFIRRFGHFN